jgi:queuine/archaeosine tRNA-ribosyltransferase
MHNLTWILQLMNRIRTAVIEDRLTALRKEIAAVWGAR